MNNQRVPSVPLITHDPYFSVWSPSDTLYGSHTESWCGAEKRITGVLEIDGNRRRFLGAGQASAMEQVALEVSATASSYVFRADGVELAVRFTSPLLLTDLELVSRPCTYLDFAVSSTDGKPHTVRLDVAFDEGHCYDGEERQALAHGVHRLDGCTAAWMGKQKQSPLNHSGDAITIDWGFLYLALPETVPGEVSYREGERSELAAVLDFGDVTDRCSATIIAAYDDVFSIVYFGEMRRAYWAREGKSILTAIEEAVADRESVLIRCALFDDNLRQQAEEAAGKDYAAVCAVAYRQTIAAHKLVTDLDDNLIFLSKECHSNGCIGTSDVSYPSVPLYLLYAPELVEGMLRPIFKFARTPVWQYPFAPHDVGRYPWANGQVYGANHRKTPNGVVHPSYYQYPRGADVYDDNLQMPVEECGNMLIMTASACIMREDFALAEENLDLLELWAGYLIEYGADPGNQLCTDDFAGHLAHNINLSAKAVMGIASFALILAQTGRDALAEQYFSKAQQRAKDWCKRASRGDHTGLTFDRDEGWSLKYNLVWDILFDTELFPQELYDSEVAHYLRMQQRFGVPLDSRKDYTKSDWIVWAASMTSDRAQTEALIAPIARFLEQSPDRVPFSDWYDTITGEHYRFQNRTVQGGLFMPLLKRRLTE